MAEVNPPPPSDVQRELEQLRAAQPAPAPLQPSVARLLSSRVKRALILWAVLIGFFLLVWQFLVPAR